MLHNRLVSALEKIGATITENTDRTRPDRFYKNFVAELDGKRIDWYTSRNFNTKIGDYDDKLYVGHVTWRSPHTDSMTDCFCDSYRDTIKGAVELLKG